MSPDGTAPQSGWGGDRSVPELRSSEYIARDHELLARAAPAFQVACLVGEALTLGVSQPDDAPIAVRSRALGIEVLRRSTGGTAVLTGAGDLAWSIVLPLQDPRVGRDFARAYARLGRPVVEALSSFGGVPTWSAAPSLSPELCLLGPRGEVLRWHGRVVGGAAQHRTSRALLHHGVLLGRVDRERTSRVSSLPPDVLAGALAGFRELGSRPESEALAATLIGRLASFVGP